MLNELFDVRYWELLEVRAELGQLPADIETIMELEEMGWCVDLITGEVRPDSDRFALTLVGECVAVADSAWRKGEGV